MRHGRDNRGSVTTQDIIRFRLFDAITSFLKNAAQSQLLMLVLDDL